MTTYETRYHASEPVRPVAVTLDGYETPRAAVRAACAMLGYLYGPGHGAVVYAADATGLRAVARLSCEEPSVVEVEDCEVAP